MTIQSIQFRIGANIFGLISSFILELGEVILAAALHRIAKYVLHRNLRSGKSVQIPIFLRTMKMLTCLSFIVFLITATILSTQQDPIEKESVKYFPCIKTTLNQDPIGTGEDNYETSIYEAIHFKCTTVNNTRVEHTTGSMRLNEGTIACDKSKAYSYVIGSQIEYSNNLHGDYTESCISSSCVRLAWIASAAHNSQPDSNKGTLYLSGSYTRGEDPESFMPTEVYTDLSQNLTSLSRIAAEMYDEGQSDQTSARRLLLMGFEKSSCAFVENNIDVTEVKIWALVLNAVVFLLSLILYIVSFFLQTSFPFDVSNPMHWATKARPDMERSVGKGPEIEAELMDDSYERVLVKGFSNPDEKKVHRT